MALLCAELLVMLLLLVSSGSGFFQPARPKSSSLLLGASIRNLRPLDPVPPSSPSSLSTEKQRDDEVLNSLKQEQKKVLEPTFEDMKKVAFILANVSDSLDTNPEIALTVCSQNMGWLFARDLPGLAQMLLTEYPALRQDTGMMRGYMFLLDFLEAVGSETSKLLKKNQDAMKSLLEAMKTSEQAVDQVFDSNEVLKSPEFLVYLDSEIQTAEPNGPMESLLVTVKLRLLEELGKSFGYDTTIIPKLAAEENPADLRRKTMEHLQSYEGVGGKDLFLQALRMMKKEMKKRYTQVDPLLLMNLAEIEKIAVEMLKREMEAEESSKYGM
jgi:hypothetical protein